ncbi:unnamed protein product [Amoebophrya sp. A25]|nr:unnamed protein product [Amoebophrya sp. A25]|eukprot:GSA25T00005365001.1
MKMEKRGNLDVFDVPARDPALGVRLQAYQNIRSASFMGFGSDKDATNGTSSDAGIYILTRFANSQQVHFVSQPMGMREQLTFLDEPVKLCVAVPSSTAEGGSGDGNGSDDTPQSGGAFLYGKDAGGDEQIQFYYFDRATGDSTMLTDGKSMHRTPKFSVSKSSSSGALKMAYSSNARDGTHFDVFLMDDLKKSVTTQETTASATAAQLIYSSGQEPGYLLLSDFYDGGYILVKHYVSASDAKIFVLEASPSSSSSSNGQTAAGESWRRRDIAPRSLPGGAPVSASVDCAQFIVDKSGEADQQQLLGVLFASGEGSNFKTLRFFDYKTEDVTEIISEDSIPWDVEDVYVGANGDIIVGYNEEGQSTFYYMRQINSSTLGASTTTTSTSCTDHGKAHGSSMKNSATSKMIQLDKDHRHVTASSLFSDLTRFQLPFCGVAGKCGFSPCGKRFGISILQATGPTDVFMLDFPSLKLTRWTRSEVGGLDTSKFVQPKLIRYRSFDGLEIPAFVYSPANRTEQDLHNNHNKTPHDKKTPVIVHPHGGPEGQHRPRFSPLYQYLVNELGVAVIDPNVRGSDGYGKVFVTLDDCEKREDSVRDICALLDWMKQDSENDNLFGFDLSRIAVWGGSYGGYMTLASLIHYPTQFKCGVDMVGISNFVTFLENTASYRRVLRRKKYGDESDPKMRALLLKMSPLTRCNEIRSPLFIVQGKNDPRVPVTEAEQIFAEMRKNEVPVWYMCADNEGHGFAKKDNVDAYQEAMVQFWRRFLLHDQELYANAATSPAGNGRAPKIARMS